MAMAKVRRKMLTLSLGVYFKFIRGYTGIKTEMSQGVHF